MMSHRNLVISIFITAVFCCSESRLSKLFDCIFSSNPEGENPGLTFIETFNIALESNDNLLKQFNVSLPPKEAYKVVHDFGLVFYTKTHATDPYQIADDFGEITQYKFEGLPPKDFASVVLKSVEQVLQEKGVLKKENAEELALKYVNFLNSARNSPDNDGSNQFNMISLYAGTFNLVQDVIPNNGDIIAEIFEHNLKLLPDRVAHTPALDDISIKIKIREEA